MLHPQTQRLQGEGSPPTAAPGLPVHGDLPVGLSREGDPGDAVGDIIGVDGTKEDKAAALLIPVRGKPSDEGPIPSPPPWQYHQHHGNATTSMSPGAPGCHSTREWSWSQPW